MRIATRMVGGLDLSISALVLSVVVMTYALFFAIQQRLIRLREARSAKPQPAANDQAFIGDDAERRYRQIVAVREEALGPDHPDVAAALAILATHLHAFGRFTEEEPLLRRALAISEIALGATHPSVATIAEDLAALCVSQRRFDEAEHLLTRVIETRLALMGATHPDVAVAYEQLAAIRAATGRNADAANNGAAIASV